MRDHQAYVLWFSHSSIAFTKERFTNAWSVVARHPVAFACRRSLRECEASHICRRGCRQYAPAARQSRRRSQTCAHPAEPTRSACSSPSLTRISPTTALVVSSTMGPSPYGSARCGFGCRCGDALQRFWIHLSSCLQGILVSRAMQHGICRQGESSEPMLARSEFRSILW